MRLRGLAEDAILSPISSFTDLIEREQTIGALSQLRLHMELIGRFHSNVKAVLEDKELKAKQTQQPR